MAKKELDRVDEYKQFMTKRYGEGSLMTLHDKPTKTPALCSTGLLGLDAAIGIGGIPKGRIIEIYGPESGGKTTLALHCAKECQLTGGQVIFIDAEHALDVHYAHNGIGVNMNKVLLSQPDYGEQAVDMVVSLLKHHRTMNDKPLLIIVDSVDALTPKKKIDGDFDEGAEGAKKQTGGMGLHARLMSQAMRNINAQLKDINASIIFINQIRMKIGVMFGSPETTSGGVALKFYASVRMDIRNIGRLDEDAGVSANKFRVRVLKNKVAPPFKEYEGINVHGFGYSQEWDLMNALEARGFMEKAGSWFSVSGIEKEPIKMQGYNGFKNWLAGEGIKDRVRKLVTEN